MCVWGSRFVAVPPLLLLQNSVIVFIVENKKRSTAVPFKTLAVSCHIRDLRQKVRYIAADGQDFDEYSSRTPLQTHVSFSDETFEPKLAV